MKTHKYVDAVDLPEERARDKRRKYYHYAYEVALMLGNDFEGYGDFNSLAEARQAIHEAEPGEYSVCQQGWVALWVPAHMEEIDDDGHMGRVKGSWDLEETEYCELVFETTKSA